MATDTEINDFCKALMSAYPNFTARDLPVMLKLWRRMLHQYDNAALVYAVDQVIRKYKFFPTLSEIIELIDDLPPAPQGKVDQLRAMALELPLEPASWYRMAETFEKAGRVSAAEHAYAKAQALGAQ